MSCIKLSMHVYRYRYKKKKKIKLWIPVLAIGIAMFVLFFQGQRGLAVKLKQMAGIKTYEKVSEFFLPGMVHEAGDRKNDTMAELILEHFFPLGEQSKAAVSYDTQVESELSYEMILAREAADENYVDEAGELVVAEEVQEIKQSPTDISLEEEKESALQTAVPQVTYPREQLNDFDFLIQNFYQVDGTTTIDGNQLNADNLLGKDMRMVQDASAPQILIYHTHSQEGYADSIPGDLATSVVGVGDYLTNILTGQYGYNVIHHRGTYDVEDRDHAYSKAGPALEQILAENPSIEVVIDLHRDGVREGTRLVTDIGGKKMAQVMFFNGLSRTTKTGDIAYLNNPYIADNLAMSFQMQLAAAKYYPGYTRRIYLKGYRYNMHYCPKTLLIEVGAQTNTFGEALNAMEPLADILNKVLTETP